MTPQRQRPEGRHSIEPIDLTGLMLDYLANWKWFVLAVIAGLAVAFVLCKRQTPVYGVLATIYLADESNSRQQSAILGGIDRVMPQADMMVDETDIQLMMSRGVVQPIVDSLGLSYQYFEKGFWREIPIYGSNAIVARMDSLSLQNLSAPISVTVKPAGDKFDIKMETTFGGESQEKKLTSELPVTISTPHGEVEISRSATTSVFSGGEQKVVISNPVSAAYAIAASFNVGYTRNSTKVLRVIMHTSDVLRGKVFLNALINQYNRNILDDKNRSALQTEEFILDRLVMISGELRDVEQRLENYKKANRIPVGIEEQAAIYTSKSNAAEEGIFNLDVQTELLRQVEAGISRQDDYSVIANIAENPELNSQITEYNRKVGNLNRTLENASPDNPLVRKMKEDLLRDKQNLMVSVAAARTNIATQKRNLQAKESTSEGRLAAVPTLDKGLQEIFREQQVKVNIYTYLLEKREEIALQKTLATPVARFIDAPESTGLISPVMRIYLLIGLVAGILLPALLILGRRLIFPTFKDRTELSRATDIPVVGEISLVKSADDIVIDRMSDNQITELFRLVRNNIEFTHPEKNKKIILVTSIISGEGKSFFATNLSVTFAMADKKVLLIGADIRRPRLHHIFDVNNKVGLTTYLAGNSSVSDIIFPSKEIENLSVLPAGPVAPNPNELLMSRCFDELLSWAEENYDYIIIDSAPIGMVSDSLIIAPKTNIQLFVVRAEFSKRRSLELLQQEVDNGRLSACYIVLNGVKMEKGSYAYRKYGSYNHKSSYGYK